MNSKYTDESIEKGINATENRHDRQIQQLIAECDKLEADNQRLADENACLRRLISKVANTPYDTSVWGYVVGMPLHNEIITFIHEQGVKRNE